jgi:DNA-binding NtrC family response regulator
MKPVVLLVEDNDSTRFGFVRYFSREGYEVSEAASLAEAAAAMADQSFDAVILDINLPDGRGLDFIATVRAQDPCIPIIVITGSGDIPLAVDAMQRGADNFLTKPVDNATLAAFLRKTLEVGVLKRRVSHRVRLEREEALFFGHTPAMEEIQHLARTAAAADNPVLITGETGTGKGLLASWIHRQGPRRSGEFVAINCSGLRGELLSRELFGNARGAFTSADQDRKGLLDIAHQGTLFLDEIGDMGMELQAQFLKVLEEKSYRRLGDVKLLRSDFRLICATHRQMDMLLQAGLFRQDLLYRINLMVIHLPPLRQRLDDLPAIAAHLLRDMGSSEAVLTDEVLRIFMDYGWPGNIRELRNVLERALLLTPPGQVIRRCHFASLSDEGRRCAAKPAGTVREMEQAHISAVLKQMGGDVSAAAHALNISRATLYRRLKEMKGAAP